MTRGPTISNTWNFFSTNFSRSVDCDRKKPFLFRGIIRDLLRYLQHKLDENNSNQRVHTDVQEYIQYTILCSLNKNTHSMYGGDCDAAIAKAAAAVTHEQTQS